MAASVATLLLDHYRRTARVLPWRAPPGAPPADPYRVWLSEVMLQQTTVATVTPRFERFVARWPTIADLASARDEEVLGEWAGLGYYSRARNLIACARAVAERGGFPTDEAGLRALPGIGDYTAAAIAGIAFGRDSMPIDTNVERVVARLAMLGDKLAIRAAALALVPPGAAGDFAQAMMDLGATICRPKAPKCGECPLRLHCRSHMLGRAEEFPPRRKKVTKPQRFGTAWWIESDGSVWLVRRPGKGLLGGMAALPGDDWNAPAPPAAPQATVRHVFSHFALDLAVVDRAAPPDGEGWWQALATIDQAGLPTLYRKAIDAVLERRRALAA
jgi:A/G-specific adenine glycosylase